MEDVIIIGGGAAGMAAAIAAAMCGDTVTLLERMDRVGRKLLATGNGRCNLMNTGELRFPGGRQMAQAVLGQMGVEEQTRFWRHLGLRLRQEEDGRVYPVSGAASTVLDTLRQSMRMLGVRERTGCTVTGLERRGSGWIVHTADTACCAKRVVVAGGGCAQPKLGSDGSTWQLLRAIGHTLVKPRPALTQIITETEAIRGLSGIRIRTDVRITGGGREKYRESGELLFADYGVTGVCVMQCARYVSPGDTFHMDLLKAMGFPSEESFREEILRRRAMWAAAPVRELLTGLCLPKLAAALMRTTGLERTHEMPAGELKSRQISHLAACAADFSLPIRGVKGFESAQVTAGGIAADEFEPETLCSRLAPGIHAAGEVLDVDGDCGGFNLMFAFGSGILAGLNGRGIPW